VELYLIRHADALPLGENGTTQDEERPLSAKGETQSEAVARALSKREIVLDKLYASPLVRAAQTASILLRVWAKPELILETCNLLAPGGKPRKLAKQLLKAEGEKIGLVGHEPDLGEFAAWLLGNKEAQIHVAKAGVVHILCEGIPSKGGGALQWMVTPEWY
jgi:phosphohistidine phosphatase